MDIASDSPFEEVGLDIENAKTKLHKKLVNVPGYQSAEVSSDMRELIVYVDQRSFKYILGKSWYGHPISIIDLPVVQHE